MTAKKKPQPLKKSKTSKPTNKPAKPRKKAPKKKGLGVVNVKMSSADRKLLVANAKRWAEGNLSAWVRHAGREYTPRKGEKISLAAA